MKPPSGKNSTWCDFASSSYASIEGTTYVTFDWLAVGIQDSKTSRLYVWIRCLSKIHLLPKTTSKQPLGFPKVPKKNILFDLQVPSKTTVSDSPKSRHCCSWNWHRGHWYRFLSCCRRRWRCRRCWRRRQAARDRHTVGGLHGGEEGLRLQAQHLKILAPNEMANRSKVQWILRKAIQNIYL